MRETENGMDKNSKGQRKLEDCQNAILPASDGHSLESITMNSNETIRLKMANW